MSPGRELVRVWNAARWSLAGLQVAVRTQASFRTDLLLAVVLVPLAFYLGASGVERALLLGSLLLLLLAELVNTAVELVVDRIGTEWHALSKQAKDVGSAVVFVALLQLVTVWGLVLWDRL